MKRLSQNQFNTLCTLVISSMLLMDSVVSYAEVKVGSNPGNLTTNSVLDVEGTGGQRAVNMRYHLCL